MSVKKDTVIRTIVLILALVNQALTIAGKNPLPFSDEFVGELVSMLFTTGASIWAWWKNNSFTKSAISADEYLKTLKGVK